MLKVSSKAIHGTVFSNTNFFFFKKTKSVKGCNDRFIPDHVPDDWNVCCENWSLQHADQLLLPVLDGSRFKRVPSWVLGKR